MSLPEMAFRIYQQVRNALEYLTFKSEYSTIDFSVESRKVLNLPDLNSLPIFTETQSLFGIEWQPTTDTDWHLDLSSGKRFPLKFAKYINIRTDHYGSAKHVWERNRLQFLTNICINHKSSGDPKYLDHFIEINRSWFRSNPYLIGVNWYSNIEVNLRLITWFLCWEILNIDSLMKSQVSIRNFVVSEWLPVIYKHCQYSYKNSSKFSSANNHLIAEACGLFLASTKWKFPESSRWLTYSRKVLEVEIIKQHSENGINREETSKYIQFITDFFLIAFIVACKSGNPMSIRYMNRLEQILKYIYHILDDYGNVLNYGDEDDGRVFVIGATSVTDNFYSLLTSGAILFKNSFFKFKCSKVDLKNKILFNQSELREFDNLPLKQLEKKSCFFPTEGHFIFNKSDQNGQVFLHLDAADLGYLSIAAHGHADALSYILHVDGQPYIVDPGTFVYHTKWEWRKYFAGTLAHNTIRVDGLDQADIKGPTLWTRHYKPTIHSVSSNHMEDTVVASHNGSNHLGVIHHRSVRFDKGQCLFEIKDSLILQNKEGHTIDFPIHLHPRIEVKSLAHNRFLLVSKKGRAVEITLDRLLKPEIVVASLDPILGWYSASFQQKEPTKVLYSKINIQETIELTTFLKVLPRSSDHDSTVF